MKTLEELIVMKVEEKVGMVAVARAIDAINARLTGPVNMETIVDRTLKDAEHGRL